MKILEFPDGTPKREIGIDQAAVVEEVLETARAWADGELSTDQALTIALDTSRAVGLAFHHCWDDARRPALERLHALEYGQRYQMVYTNFGWLGRTAFEAVQRNMSYRATFRDDDEGWVA